MDLYDYVVVGSGPAGIQIGYFLEKKKAKYVILEKGSKVATFFRTFPRQRGLISINKVYCGEMDNYENVLRYDWNSLLLEGEEDIANTPYFRDFSKEYYPKVDSLLEYLQTFVDKHGIRIQYQTSVYNISKNPSGTFEVNMIYENTQTKIEAKKVIIASGLSPKIPNNIKITYIPPNRELYYYSTMPLDPLVYQNKNILIIGSGNAAFETANYLNNFTNSINLIGSEKLAYNTHYPGYLRSINMPILDSYYLKSKVVLNWSTSVNTEDDSRLHKCLESLNNGKLWHMIDIVIVCVGFTPALGYLDSKLGVITNTKGFPLLTPFFESVTCKDLFFAGALTQEHDYKKGTSAFIHGFRYNARVLKNALYNEFTVYNNLSIKKTIDIYFRHINHSSALFHRFDYIGDAILVNDKEDITYIYEIPELVITDNQYESYLGKITKNNFQYVCFVKLGYNPNKKMFPNFSQLQAGQFMQQRDESVFIHPIITIYQRNKATMKCLHIIHLPEEAMNIFINQDLYYKPVYSLLKLLTNNNDLRESHIRNFDHMLNISVR